jgi:hypothetical protein
MQTASVADNPAGLKSLLIAQQLRSSVNPQYSPQHYPPDAHHTRVLLNQGVPVEQGQPIVPSQHQVHYFTRQKPYSNPAMQMQIEDPAYTKLADVNTAYNSRKDGISMNVNSDQGLRYTPVETMPNFKVSSTVRPVTAERRYFCDCGRHYSQPQGVLRHRRAAHNIPHSCFSLRCEFKWTRPCEYRTHLEKRHPKVNPAKVLGKPAGDRCRSTIVGRDLAPMEYDRRSQAEPRQRPMTPPLPALAKVTHVPPPAMSPVAYDPQFEYAEPAVTTRKHDEDARGLEFVGAADASNLGWYILFLRYICNF